MNKQKTKPSYEQQRAEVERALSEYQKKAADLTDTEEIGKILDKESDRGIVVTYVSFLEDALIDRVVAKLGVPVAARKKLTKGSGSLSNNSAVADLALEMGLLHPTHYNMLYVMRMMRNACAHCRREINFTTPQLKDALGLLFDDPSPQGTQILDVIDARATRELFILIAANMLDGISGENPDDTKLSHVLRTTAILNKLRGVPASLPRRRRSPVSHEPPETN